MCTVLGACAGLKCRAVVRECVKRAACFNTLYTMMADDDALLSTTGMLLLRSLVTLEYVLVVTSAVEVLYTGILMFTFSESFCSYVYMLACACSICVYICASYAFNECMFVRTYVCVCKYDLYLCVHVCLCACMCVLHVCA